jgi:hypothetical protein
MKGGTPDPLTLPDRAHESPMVSLPGLSVYGMCRLRLTKISALPLTSSSNATYK